LHTSPVLRVDLLLKQTLHTNPTSTTFLWQKHAALKSTPPALGMTSTLLAVASGKNPIIKYCRIPSGLSGFMYTPPVASEACCSSTVSPANLRISMGMCFRCAAKMLFITGIYWLARSPETLTIRMREVSGTRWTCVLSLSAREERGLSTPVSTGECRRTDFEM
jgi:hypothetical protein